MRRTILLLALALSGCDKWKPAHQPVEPPTAAQEAKAEASDFSKPILARGNEPFWSLKIDGVTFTLSRPGQPDVVYLAPGAQITPGRAVWVAKGADGRTLTATLFASECSDGMSEQEYPMTAEVALDRETLRGCADRVSNMPKAAAAGD